ncbi:MAG TPA: cupin domain-containing protein [Nitrososphaerales archaeon]|nr:cupin domain-containing protein [Nitrososphaerales archaeon]
MEKTIVYKIIPESEIFTHNNQRKQGITTTFADPTDLVGLVSYQEGAVISKTLVNSESGSVTLFAFDQGQGLSEHVSPFDALVQALEGTVEITVSGKPAQLTMGQILTLPRNQPHALNALSKFKMLLTMIRSR